MSIDVVAMVQDGGVGPRVRTIRGDKQAKHMVDQAISLKT